MAGDWIKMRVWLRKDPRVASMADYLATDRAFMNYVTDPVQISCKETVYEHITSDVTRSITVVSLLEVWGVAREQGDREDDDLVLNHCDLTNIDDICSTPSFGDAMEYVDWVIQESFEDKKGRKVSRVRFPKFFKDNESPEDRYKKQHADAQARYREKQKKLAEENGDNNDITSDITGDKCSDITVTHREEKRREDITTSMSSAKPDDKFPECPHQEIINLYQQALPELPQPRVWNDSRKKQLKARWIWILKTTKPNGDRYATNPTEAMDFFKRFFEYVSKSDFLMGRASGNWQADLAWLCKDENFAKVIEGKYENKAVA